MEEPDSAAREASLQEALKLEEQRPHWQRVLWCIGGLTAVAIGAVGVVVPGLPTTPLLLVAAACFSRSSPRLYAWLLRNGTFGPLIDDYRSGRGITLRVKTSAVAMMTLFTAFALLVPLRGRPYSAAAVLALSVYGSYFVLRIPTKRS